jgi:hypothetical protein
VAVTHAGGRYLLAPSGGVAYGSQLRLHVPGVDKPFPARIAHLAVECELAVLQPVAAVEEVGRTNPRRLFEPVLPIYRSPSASSGLTPRTVSGP